MVVEESMLAAGKIKLGNTIRALKSLSMEGGVNVHKNIIIIYYLVWG